LSDVSAGIRSLLVSQLLIQENQFSIRSMNLQFGKRLFSSSFSYVKFPSVAWWLTWEWSADHQLFNCGWSCTAQQLRMCFMIADNFYTSTGVVPCMFLIGENFCIFPSLTSETSKLMPWKKEK